MAVAPPPRLASRTQGVAGGDAVDAAGGDDQGGGDARVVAHSICCGLRAECEALRARSERSAPSLAERTAALYPLLMLRFAPWLLVPGSVAVLGACTSFTTDAAVDPPVSDAGADVSDAGDAAAPGPQEGCDAPTLTDFSAPLEAPFSHDGAPLPFEPMTEGKLSFGRFTFALTDGAGGGGAGDGGAPDGGPADDGGALEGGANDGATVVDRSYFLAINEASTFACVSARTRVLVPPPSVVDVSLLSMLAPSRGSTAYGFTALLVTGTAESVLAGWRTEKEESPVNRVFLTSIKVNDWQVTRLELRRVGVFGWRANVFVNGQLVLDDADAFPRATLTAGGSVAIGPSLASSNVPRPAPPVVVDYADLRFAQHL